jgi:hypothetical protein
VLNDRRDDVTAIIAALKRSGFPLPTRVMHEIEQRRARGWRFLASEYPWRGPYVEDQFIDLVASCGTVVLVVECKKAQERSLLFLRPLGRESTGQLKDFTAWQLEKRPSQIPDVVLRDDFSLEPSSYQAQFCVSTEKSSERLLEQDARRVVFAADAVVETFSRADLPSRSFVIPVIVTPHRLYTLRFRPTEISLETGDFSNLDHTQIEPIPWVRFHKTLAARLGNRPRTVFVVNAGSLPTFLDEVSRGQGATIG